MFLYSTADALRCLPDKTGRNNDVASLTVIRFTSELGMSIVTN